MSHCRPGLSLQSSIRGDLPLKTWKHITITYDGSTNSKNIKFFIDGKKRTDSFFSGHLLERAEKLPAIDSSKTQLHFGCHRFAELAYYGSSSAIDELRIYDRVLSPEEVEEVSSYGLE